MRNLLSFTRTGIFLVPLILFQACQTGCPIEISAIEYDQSQRYFPGAEVSLQANISNSRNCPIQISWSTSEGVLSQNSGSTSTKLSTDCEAKNYLIRLEVKDEKDKVIASKELNLPIENLAPLKVIDEYISSGFYGDYPNIQLEKVHFRGRDADKYSFSPYGSEGYAGVYYQYPENNWGDTLGKDLTGYNWLSFYACSPDRASVSFVAGGVSDAQMPYKDSFKGVTGFIDLTPEWVRYDINLLNRDLSRVIGGFAWVTNKNYNTRPVNFYIADIEYSRVNCPE